MGKSLIIAEKPSVAADIAKAIGGFTRQGEFFESDDYVLSSAVGHLVEIAAPEQFEVKRGKWSFANLPVIPPHFDVQPIAKNEERLKMLARLIRRKDVDGLINACDAGREGELIFRLISQYAKARQPVRRLWLQSMTPAAIREAFKNLRDDQQMMPLADAARCRSEADWLVGINGTRAMTAFNSRDGGFYLTTVGRVQTPTLAIVVDREDRIRRFVSRDYFEIRGTFQAKAGQYEGRWFDPQFRKGEDAEARAERLWERPSADAIAAACKGQPGIVSEEAKPSTQIAPQLFDLTSLQREANGRFGFSAKTTLSLAQALYEKHKVLTYPRTDARVLPEDYIATVNETLSMLEEQGAFAPFARQILANSWVRPNKRVFDNTKISDHFAIIPTLQAPRALSDAEQRIYDLVVRRFLSVFFPPAEYQVTTRITEVAKHLFKTEGRVMVNAGWLAIYGRAGADAPTPVGGAAKADATLVAIDANERVLTLEAEVMALATRPPARYNEGTLLSAMEGAGKTIEDDELREAMADKGLGTPATRAAIIEGLIAENYLLRDGRDLLPTTKAFQLLTLLRGLGVEELTLPELTGNWEYKLSQMERGRLQRDEFMQEIAEVTRRIVERAKNYQADTVPGDYATLAAPCPKCGGVVQENYKRFACTKCDFSITKIPGSRQLDVTEAETLLTERTLGPLQGFRSRLGRPFAAILKITDEHKLEFDFGQSRDDDDANAEPIDFSGQPALGGCPKCGSQVYDHGLSYVCEKSVGPNRSCDFRSGKIILQQEIAPEQMRKLLTEGKTELLTNFVSQRTRRKFKAFLVRGADGKIGFEFAARPGKEKAAGDEEQDDGAAKPSAARPGAARTTAARKPAVTKPTLTAPTAGKPAAKKPAAKKPAAKKSAAKKPAAKKPAAKKPAAVTAAASPAKAAAPARSPRAKNA
jgi:DNA topoisomerase-3